MYETHTFEDPLVLDPAIRARWTFLETSSAAAVLRAVCPYEWYEITNVLANFSLVPNQWLEVVVTRWSLRLLSPNDNNNPHTPTRPSAA